jgi:hypothetical protein
MYLLPAAPTRFCWICGRMIQLQTLATDEHGSSVHEDCYVLRGALKKASASAVAARLPEGQGSARQYLRGFSVRNV